MNSKIFMQWTVIVSVFTLTIASSFAQQVTGDAW